MVNVLDLLSASSVEMYLCYLTCGILSSICLYIVYCRPFWAILKNFKLAVYSSIPHLTQKGQKVDNTPSEASGKYNTITVKSQTVTKADCVGALWCLLVLNLAVACVAGVFENDEEGEGEKFLFLPIPFHFLHFFFRETTTICFEQ